MHMKEMNSEQFSITIISKDPGTYKHAKTNMDKANITFRKQ
jgi:hypothetical protein